MHIGPNQRKALDFLKTTTLKQNSTYEMHNELDNSYCALGAMCVALDLPPGHINALINAVGLRSGLGRPSYGSTLQSITILNDCDGLSFAEIATIIEDNAEAYFKESK